MAMMRWRVFGYLMFLLGVTGVFFSGYNLARKQAMDRMIEHLKVDLADRVGRADECAAALKVQSDEMKRIAIALRGGVPASEKPTQMTACVRVKSHEQFFAAEVMNPEDCIRWAKKAAARNP